MVHIRILHCRFMISHHFTYNSDWHCSCCCLQLQTLGSEFHATVYPCVLFQLESYQNNFIATGKSHMNEPQMQSYIDNFSNLDQENMVSFIFIFVCLKSFRCSYISCINVAVHIIIYILGYILYPS